MAQNIFLISARNFHLPDCTFCLLSQPECCACWEESVSISSTLFQQEFIPVFSRLNKSNSLSLCPWCAPALSHLSCPQLDLLPGVNLFLYWEVSNRTVWSSHKCQRAEEYPFPHPASSTAANTDEDVAPFLHCKCTLMTLNQFAVSQDLKLLLCKAAS